MVHLVWMILVVLTDLDLLERYSSDLENLEDQALTWRHLGLPRGTGG